ncbi:GntR family transcriptional regulator [Amycolatopsis methanolica]|uniref:GntR family transcriptional regulator n=1 Tax=Amycolatopsis methanolica TaxID=1814 RepID=UPI00341BC8D7
MDTHQIASRPGRRRAATRLNEAVYEQLKERLMEGRYPAGERLSPEALRVEFGVSKQPVMEALRRLAADGMLDIRAQIGSEVKAYSMREVADFYVMFGGFEGTIAGMAAQRRTDDQLVELDVISARVDALRAERDPAARAHGYRVLNRRFHDAIHQMAHSQIAADTSRRLWDLSDFLINTTGVPRPLSSALDERHADHESIRAAIHDRDAERARREMEKHIVTTVDVITAEAGAAEDLRGA